MRSNKRKGVAIVEFCFVMLVLTPLMLGTIGFGLRLLQQMETIQLSRDAGRMYARNLDFSLPGNQDTLLTMGRDLNLTKNSSGDAVVILSKIVYVDAGYCQTGGSGVDASGNPTNCPNWKQWVFAQRIVVGNESLRTSNVGSPFSVQPKTTPISAAADGTISEAQQISNPNAVASFAALGNPFMKVLSSGQLGITLDQLPSGTKLFMSEAAAKGFAMAPFANPGQIYTYTVF